MSPSDNNLGLYVHIPFCHRRCHFCAFYLEIARPDPMARFHSALIQEIALHRRQDSLNGRALQSIYFGGGTPTSLPANQLATLLTLIRETWPTNPTTEITVEAHPSSVTEGDLTVLADAGFNRISFGAESMTDKDFAFIGRFGQVQFPRGRRWRTLQQSRQRFRPTASGHGRKSCHAAMRCFPKADPGDGSDLAPYPSHRSRGTRLHAQSRSRPALLRRAAAPALPAQQSALPRPYPGSPYLDRPKPVLAAAVHRPTATKEAYGRPCETAGPRSSQYALRTRQ